MSTRAVNSSGATSRAATPTGVLRDGSLRLRLACLAVMLFLGAAQCWRYRHAMYPDGVQYLDIAQQFARRGLPALLNGCWSPLYPLLIGLVLLAGRPAPYWLYPSVQLVNVFSFVAALLSFDYFLRSVIAFRGEPDDEELDAWLPAGAFIVITYACLTVTLVYLLNVRTMTPDMLVAAGVFAVSGLLLTALREGFSPSRSVAMGAVLAAAFCAKGVMFPASALYFATMLIVRRDRRDAWRALAFAVGAFLLVSLPWIGSLSWWKGRATYGDIGPLMYAGWVNQWPNFHWIGLPSESGVPLHGVRQITAHPDAFAFDWPLRVTYAQYYDPTYWDEGLRTRFHVPNQMRALGRTLTELAGIFRLGFTALGPALIGLTLFSSNPRAWMERWRPYALVWIPVLLTIALYLTVHIEGRMIAAQLQVLATIGLATLRFERDRVRAIGRAAAAALCGAALVTAGPVAAGAVRQTALDMRFGEARERPVDWGVAKSLLAAGLVRGDRVAVVGNTLDVTWAQLAGLSIVAEISADQLPAYLAVSDEARGAVIAALRLQDARAIVARSRAPIFNQGPWVRIEGTEFALYRFP